MTEEQPAAGAGRVPGPPGTVPAAASRPAPRPGYWFPLLLFGVLTALSLPLSVRLSPHPAGSGIFLARAVYPTVPQALYLGGGSVIPPFPFPLGWYWIGTLAAGIPLTAAWCRWRGRRAGTRTPLRGFLVSGLVLTAVTTALPLLGWGMPVPLGEPGTPAWLWLSDLWRLGTFALLAMAVCLGVLARASRSRPLAVITAVYTIAVCLTGWLRLQPAAADPFLLIAGFGDRTVLLPAAVLLAAGLGALAAAAVRALRSGRGRNPA